MKRDNKNLFKGLAIVALIGVFSFSNLAQGQNQANDLQQLIDQKNGELQGILSQKEALENELKDIAASGNTLKKEISTINNGIAQLDLGIKANRTLVQRLELEIQGINGDINKIENDIEKKRDSITKLVIEMQQQENDNLLFILLKNKTLSESVTHLEEIMSLNSGLNKEIDSLNDSRTELTVQLSNSKQKQEAKNIEKINLANRQQIIADQKKTKEVILKQTKNQEKVYQQQIAELEKKQGEISAIIEDAEQQLREDFNVSVLPTKRPGVFSFPVNNPSLTQDYGATSFAQRAYKSKFHNGVDFRASVGTPILAALDGRIKNTDNNDIGTSRWQKFQYGRYILIEHGNGITSLYGHLSKTVVSPGQTVKTGDLIGYSGNTGYSTGPHLHFTFYWTPSVQLKKISPAAGLVPIGVTINPKDYLPSF
ncbi:MAG: peptidoglycan DD-metalloendopeptidase family protein [bacterium]|nr:peptidoglycan DD-metalloendopeptidase family protein [bacterium]